MPIDSSNRHPYNSYMTTQEAVRFYGTQRALAEALHIKQSSVAEWGEYPPALRQLQIERATKNKLKAESDALKPRAKAA
jgi:DNA-binding transcriptional regulator YdaS (Cro superfamily)